MGDANIRVVSFKRLEPEKTRLQKIRENVAHRAISLCPKHLCSSSSLDTSQCNKVRVVCISDTHNAQPELPQGDILIHAGDLSDRGTRDEVQAQLTWLDSQPGFAHKLVIGGNHDFALHEAHSALDFGSVTYLQDETVTLTIQSPTSLSKNPLSARTLKIHGTPWTPEYGKWAFQYPRPLGTAFWTAPEHRIPPDTDILITHGPPHGHVDTEDGTASSRHLGCAGLAAAVPAARPRLVVCGHVHGARGRVDVVFDRARVALERILAGESGWSALLMLLCGIFGAWIRWMFGSEGAPGTAIVNAAHQRAAGAAEDEDERGAFVVSI